MHTLSELVRADLDRQIRRALAARVQNARTPERVWQRVLHRTVNSGGPRQLTARDTLADAAQG